MPGDNCGFLGCHTNRKTRDHRNPDRYLSLFRIPTTNETDSEHTRETKKKARDEWIRIVCETRLRDTALQRQFDRGTFSLCELHFDPDDIEIFPSRRILNTGSVPTRLLPRNTFSQQGVKNESVVSDIPPQTMSAHDSVLSAANSFRAMKQTPWRLEDHGEQLWFIYDDPDTWVPKFLVTVLKMDASVLCYFYGWKLPANALQANSLTTVLAALASSFTCNGLPTECLNQDTLTHSVPRKPTVSQTANDLFQQQPYSATHIIRSKNCCVLVSRENDNCLNCHKIQRRHKARAQKALSRKVLPAKRKAPLTACSKEKLVATVQASRVQCAQLKEQLERMTEAICCSGLQVVIRQEPNMNVVTQSCSTNSDGDTYSHESDRPGEQ